MSHELRSGNPELKEDSRSLKKNSYSKCEGKVKCEQ